MNALLEQLEASRPAREQQKHAEFQQLAIDVANEINMDVEAIPATLERLGRTTDELREAVEKYPKRLAAHREIETAQAAAERMPGIQQELEDIQTERVRINQKLDAKARPFVQEREQAVTAISKGTYSEEFLRSTCTDPVRLAAVAAVEEQRQEVIRSRVVVVQQLRDRDIWLLQVSQWGDDAASHDQSIFEKKKAGRAEIAAELDALNSKLSELETRYIEARKALLDADAL